MASNKKTTSSGSNGKRNTGTRKKSGNTAKRKTSQERYYDGVMITVAVAVMLFIMCCNFGFCGIFGKGISTVLFGLFGLVQFVIPIAVCVGLVMAVYYDYSGFIMRKITLSVIFTLFLCALCHMAVHIDWGFEQLAQSFVYSSDHRTAGGFFGALITGMFYPFLAKSGTWILVIFVLIILFILIAGASVIDIVKSITDWYSLDEEELVAREEYLSKRKERVQEQQRQRKDARKQKYQEAALREDEQLSELELKRLERRRQLESEGFSSQNIRLKAGEMEKDKGLVPGKAHTDKVLSDKGLTDGESTVSRRKKSKREQKNKESELSNDEIVQNITDIAEHSSGKRVVVEPSGELHITGLVGEESDTGLESAHAFNDNHNIRPDFEENIMPVSSFFTDGHGEKKEKVTNTVAQFVAEEDLPKEEDNKASSLEETASLAQKQTTRRRTKESARETAIETDKTAQEIVAVKAAQQNTNYEKPLLELLSRGQKVKGNSKAELKATAKKLEETLESFGVHVKVTDVSCGPAVTRYEMLPEQGTRVNKITGLADDIKLNLAVADIRIEAPIPGKAAIGIEVPNKEAASVAFRDLLEDSDFMEQESDLAFAVGKDIGGQVVISDIGKMPHVLIAGATGSGKSVCINTLIMSLLYKAHPDEVKLIMIDPKVVELSVYNGIPHLMIPVVTDPKKASGALNWAVAEMDARYKKFAEYNVRNLEGYNKKMEALIAKGEVLNEDEPPAKMPKIVIIVDELADLMMVAHGEVEDAIVRLSQLARAAGIHLVIATQRPSVDVITGLIKANVPSRIAFAVSSGVDSRTILDMNGAEKLLGKGDMLFSPSGYPKPIRVQGAFISDKEVGRVVEFLKAQGLKVQYNDNITREINCGPKSLRDANKGQDRDEYFEDAGKFIIEKNKASIGMLQRVYKVGFNRAARIMDQLSEAGVVGPEEGTKPRQILMSMEEFEAFLSK